MLGDKIKNKINFDCFINFFQSKFFKLACCLKFSRNIQGFAQIYKQSFLILYLHYNRNTSKTINWRANYHAALVLFSEAEDEINHLKLEVDSFGSENERLHKELHSLQNQLCKAEDKIHELEHRLKDALQIISR